MTFNETGRVLLAGAALLTAASLAQAQYLWLDEKGVKQLSDQPPPPSVPQQRILKQPRAQQVLLSPAAPDSAHSDESAEAAPGKPGRPLTLTERNAEFNKRREDAQSNEKKAAQEAAERARKDENCEIARNNQRALDDGIRIGSYDKSGQRVLLTDQQRTGMAQRNARTLADCAR